MNATLQRTGHLTWRLEEGVIADVNARTGEVVVAWLNGPRGPSGPGGGA